MKKIPFHPIVFTIYPAIALLIHNSQQVLLRDITYTILISLGLLIVAWIVFYFITHRNPARSAVLTSSFLTLFFSYGHIMGWLTVFLMNSKWSGLMFLISSRPGILLTMVVWIGLFVVFSILVMKAKFDPAMLTGFFNIMAIVIIIFQVYDWYSLNYSQKDDTVQEYVNQWRSDLKKEASFEAAVEPGHSAPDIYYIILDGYARQDILQDLYHYDNSEFIAFLDGQGFYVAEQSRCNYVQTILSLPSSLNFSYLDDVAEKVGKEVQTNYPLRVMLEQNRLGLFLKSQGYVIRNVPTGFFFTDKIEADMVDSPDWRMDAFQSQFFNITPLPMAADLLGLNGPFDIHRQRILYAFEHLDDRPATDQPVFTFAHILAPHPPFVFGAQGQPVRPVGYFRLFDADQYLGTPEEYMQSYLDQLIYITAKTRELIPQLKAASDRPLIVIIQGDHGPGSHLNWRDPGGSYLPERFSILNAYYFYDGDYSLLYPSISPVNSFRVILDQYFGTELGLLEDRSYFASPGRPYDYLEVGEDSLLVK